MIKKIRKLFFILASLNFRLIYSLIKGVAAGTEHLNFLSCFKNLNTIVDIGAHQGQFALISKYKFKSAKIYSFDPLKNSMMKYSQILKVKDGCTFFNTAIGNTNSLKKINISKKDDSSSILTITDQQTKTFKNTEKIDEEDIKIQKLNDCIDKNTLNKPCLMKIDVQGYELEVLKGSEQLLKYFDYLYIECSSVEFYKNQPLFDDINNWLNKRNFSFVKSYNDYKDLENKTIQADYYFINEHLE